MTRFSIAPTARAALIATALAVPSLGLAADSAPQADTTTSQEVRQEISEAFAAIGDYSAEQRDEALAAAREAMTRLDAEIDRRQDALRDGWSDMSEAARDKAREGLQQLQAARYRLSERYGALESGADSAWDDLKQGFAEAYDSLRDLWNDEGPAPEADSPK
ncbi:hypothetical protein [Pseudodonghicola flavimaris]|uniref:Uncharacterized protein n=1 Tax=Pseudodonghicola flavimaris TaxID=3050036 RepID=A0ABT7F1W5_9RHOB|nr:hypothetical protein [Pseudodonghicola flavimaris]MDK3018449.1 hypothetical protein [Pseudodonghicola flavimaris]